MLSKENCIEHEQHFLTYCQGYTTHVSYIPTFQTAMQFTKVLSDHERTKCLLRVENENTCKIIGKYIHLMFTKRKEILNS